MYQIKFIWFFFVYANDINNYDKFKDIAGNVYQRIFE